MQRICRGRHHHHHCLRVEDRRHDRLHRSAPGFKILATDYPPSLPKGRVNVNEEILGSKFCLCPSGTGWGMRVFHVMVLGCVPVLVQHDGEHPPVAQAFEPEVLDWHEFAVAVEHDEVKDLPQILEGVDLAAKQAALARVWARMVWRGALRWRRHTSYRSPKE